MAVNPNKMFGEKESGEALIIPTDAQYRFGPYSPGGVFSDFTHENLLKSKGFKSVHYKHALNPNRETPEGGVNVDATDNTGMQFFDPKPLYIVPQNINWQEQYFVQGLHGSHTFVANHTGYYTNTEERVYLRPNDIIVFEDIDHGLVLTQQLVAYDPTAPLKLKFPALKVEYMVDDATRYEENSDFCLSCGLIYWTENGNKPSYDANKKRGKTVSIVYWTKPVFVVKATPRIFRTVWSNAFAQPTVEATATYLPGSAVLSMSWLTPEVIGDNIIWPGMNFTQRKENGY